MLERLNAKREAYESGFTLIELLIVVIILGILAAIVVFSVTGLNNTASAASCQTTVKTVDTAAEAFYAQSATGTGAATIGALVGGGFLHADTNFTSAAGTSVIIPGSGGYTITFSPIGSKGVAGSADTSVCP